MDVRSFASRCLSWTAPAPFAAAGTMMAVEATNISETGFMLARPKALVERIKQQVLVRCACLLLMLIAIALIVAIYDVTRDPWDRNEYNRVVRKTVDVVYREHLESHPDEAFVVVTISVRSIDLAEYDVGAVVTTRFVDGRLVDANGTTLGTERTDSTGVTTTSSATGSAMNAEIKTLIATAHGQTEVATPGSHFDRDTASATVATTLAVSGFPQDFPSDSYDLRAMSWIQLPDDISVKLDRSNLTTRSIRTYTVFELGSGLSYWRGREGDPAFSTSDVRLLHVKSIRLFRPPKFSQFVWAVCSVPVLFMALYFLLSLAGYFKQATSHFELGAAILAIISMRQIFVPEGPLGFTTLDHWLGLSLILCVLFAAIIAKRARRYSVDQFDDGLHDRPEAVEERSGYVVQRTIFGNAVLLPNDMER